MWKTALIYQLYICYLCDLFTELSKQRASITLPMFFIVLLHCSEESSPQWGTPGSASHQQAHLPAVSHSSYCSDRSQAFCVLNWTRYLIFFKLDPPRKHLRSQSFSCCQTLTSLCDTIVENDFIGHSKMNSTKQWPFLLDAFEFMLVCVTWKMLV